MPSFISCHRKHGPGKSDVRNPGFAVGNNELPFALLNVRKRE